MTPFAKRILANGLTALAVLLASCENAEAHGAGHYHHGHDHHHGHGHDHHDFFASEGEENVEKVIAATRNLRQGGDARHLSRFYGGIGDAPFTTGENQSRLDGARADGSFFVSGRRYKSQKDFVDSGGRCSTKKPSDSEWKENVKELKAAEKRLNSDDMEHVRRRLQSAPIVVPVNFVIISSSAGEGSISDAELQAQIDVLNKAFAPQFTFQPYNIQRVVNDAFFNGCFQYGYQYKPMYRQGGPETLNLFTCNGGGVLGFANLPSNGGARAANDGVVVSHHTLPGRSQGAYGLGHVSASPSSLDLPAHIPHILIDRLVC
jgi:hypothetical protein